MRDYETMTTKEKEEANDYEFFLEVLAAMIFSLYQDKRDNGMTKNEALSEVRRSRSIQSASQGAAAADLEEVYSAAVATY